jgi:Ca2+-binding RTX toxin-like protein
MNYSIPSSVIAILLTFTITSLSNAFISTNETFAEVKGGTGENDLITGTDGSDNIRGLQGDDTIHGGFSNDFLYGNSGNDRMFGDAGEDVLAGDIGAERRGADTFHCGSGRDTILDFEPNEGDTQVDCEVFNP